MKLVEHRQAILLTDQELFTILKLPVGKARIITTHLSDKPNGVIFEVQLLQSIQKGGN